MAKSKNKALGEYFIKRVRLRVKNTEKIIKEVNVIVYLRACKDLSAIASITGCFIHIANRLQTLKKKYISCLF